MKISLIMLFVAFQLQAATGYAQKTSIPIHFSNTTVEEVLNQIEKNSDYVFLFNDKNINIKRIVSVKSENCEISKILNEVFAGTNVKYTIVDKQIILKEKAENKSAEQKAKRQIKGVVSDDANEPLIGVSVLVKGSTVGTITDIDGNYSLEIPGDDAVLEFSYIGYQKATIHVAGRTSFYITMKEDAQQLNEVVVTAMGIERAAKSLTYATQTVKGEELTRAKDANFINSLQGKSAGLVITPNAGGAGSASKILLRGNRSILGGNSPLIVVDGIPMNNSITGKAAAGSNIDYGGVNEGSDALSNINSDDIETITVLKGANAAALYGSQAANGVIMVTTKKGKEGKIKIDISSSSTFETPLVLPELQNTYGADLYRRGDEMKLSELSWGGKISDMTPEERAVKGIASAPQDYVKDFFNTGTNFNNSIAVSGGTEKVQSYFSVNNTTAKGIIPNNKFNRTILNFRESFSLFGDKLKINLSANYINQKNNNPVSGGKWLNPLYNLYTAPRNVDMEYYKQHYESPGSWQSEEIMFYPDWQIGTPAGDLQPYSGTITLRGDNKQNWFTPERGIPAANNPYWIANRVQNETLLQRFYTTVGVSYSITKELNAQARFSYDRTNTNSDTKTYATTVGLMGTMIDRGQYSWSTNWTEDVFGDFLLSYNKELPKDFGLSLTGGISLNKKKGENIWLRNTGPGSTERYTSPDLFPKAVNVFYVDAGYSPTRTYELSSDWYKSLFATGQLSWRSGVYLDLSYRTDWSRAFSQFAGTGSGLPTHYNYYSVGANVILNELVHLPAVIDRLKFRGSFSEVGNSIPNQFYNGMEKDPATGTYIPPVYVSVTHLRPETMRSTEFGFDLSMFDARLNMEVTYYNSKMFNQFLTIAASSGGVLPINTGEVRNRGVEATVSYNLIINKNWSWKTGFNFSYNDNKIIKTYKNRDDIFTSIGASGNIYARYREGGSYGDLYVRDYKRYNKNHENKGLEYNGRKVKVGEIMLSKEGVPLIDNEGGHELYIGNMNAKVNLGWHNTINYKNLSFYFLIDGKVGGKVISFTEAYLDYSGVSKRTGDARSSGLTMTHPYTKKTVSAIVLPDGNLAPTKEFYQTVGGQVFPQEYIYDGTNFRLREVALRYTFKSLFGASKDLNVSLVGRNLFFLYKDAPIDPDASLSTQNSLGGVDVFNAPTTRSFGINLNLNF